MSYTGVQVEACIGYQLAFNGWDKVNKFIFEISCQHIFLQSGPVY